MGPKGLLHLLLLFYFQEGSQASYAESIREKLRCFRVHPSMYTWQRFRAQNAVYMKVAVDWRHFSISVEHYRQPSTFMYIGSTNQSVFRRESNRLSVAKKLFAGGEAQASCGEHFLSHPCLKDFQHLSFYGVQLEEVTNHQFLDFRLNAADRTVTYITYNQTKPGPFEPAFSR